MILTNKINRPNDDYSPLWPAYWAQNPHLARGIGADAADAPPPSDAPAAIDPAEFKKLQDTLAALSTENETYKTKHQEAEKHRKEADRIAKENALKAAKAGGDIEALEKSWGEKYTQREQELSGELGTFRSMVEELTAGSTASDICNKIAMEGCAPALMPHVRGRLKSEVVDGKPVTRVLDSHGKISAMTPDDLIKELRSIPYLAPLIVGSKAGGAGTPGGQGQGGQATITRAQFAAMNPAEQSNAIASKVNIVDA